MKHQFTAVLCICLTLAAPCWAVYNPRTGRFMQRDPVGPVNPAQITPLVDRAAIFRPQYGSPTANREYHDGMNLYQYARANPLSRTDPSGQFSILDPLMTSGTSFYLMAATAMAVAGAAGKYVGSVMAGVGMHNAATEAAIFGAKMFAVGVGVGMVAEVAFLRAETLITTGSAAATGAGDLIRGLYGTVTRGELLRLGASGGSTTPVITSLTQPPLVGRALSVATGPNAQALTRATTGSGRQVFTAHIPNALLEKMYEVGLARLSTTMMQGVVGGEIRFQAAASEFIAPLFSLAPK